MNEIEQTDYVVFGKIYLKDEISIECTEYFGEVQNSLPHPFDPDVSNEHYWFRVSHSIEVLYLDRNGFIFKYGDKKLVYWCDVLIFFNKCYLGNEVREMKINQILSELGIC